MAPPIYWRLLAPGFSPALTGSVWDGKPFKPFLIFVATSFTALKRGANVMALTRSQHQTNHDRPLAGRTVVITRAINQAADFAAELEAYGATVVVCPTIEITEPDSFARLDEAIDHLYGYDWLIFTSVNGVDYFLRRLKDQGHDVSEMDDLKVCAIGDATAEKLREGKVHVDVIPQEFKAEGVYAALERFVGGAEALAGINVLLPRASVARDYLPKALELSGARVDVVPAYQTKLPDNLDRGRLAATFSGTADCIAFTSSSTVRNLAQLFDTHDLTEVLSGVEIACIGDITASTAAEHGLNVAIQPSEFTIPALARAIADHFAQHPSADSTD
jgi:uroporphyrinogen III methyltransferase / synthase